MNKYVLMSQTEKGFWSISQGWVWDKASATIRHSKSLPETSTITILVPDAIWVNIDDAPETFDETY